MQRNLKKLSNEILDAYVRQAQGGPCFVCQVRDGTNPYRHHMIYEDPEALVFLTRDQPLLGYTLVAPRDHREHVVRDFDEGEYLSLQKLVYRVGNAIQATVPTERLYVLSFGSQQGNSHVHWHVAPLPPSVPYNLQQDEAIKTGNGIVDLSEQSKATLAVKIRESLDRFLRP